MLICQRRITAQRVLADSLCFRVDRWTRSSIYACHFFFLNLPVRSVLTFRDPSVEDLGLYTVEMSDNPHLSSSYDFTAEGTATVQWGSHEWKLVKVEKNRISFVPLPPPYFTEEANGRRKIQSCHFQGLMSFPTKQVITRLTAISTRSHIRTKHMFPVYFSA